MYRRTGGKQQVYIKISEAEIADDYPEPTQYDKVQPVVCARLSRHAMPVQPGNVNNALLIPLTV